MYLERVKPIERLEDLAKEKHWGVRDLGYKEVPTIPIFVDGFWEEPLTEFITNSTAVKRLQAIQTAQIPVRGYFIRHETSRLLTAPQRVIKPFPWKRVMVAGMAGLAVTGVAVGLLAVLAVVVAAAAVAIPVMLLLPLLVLDPALVVVLPNGEAVEVSRWLQ